MVDRDLELDRNWFKLLNKLEKTIGKRPAGLNGVLFLIGVQELGRGAKAFSKEQKRLDAHCHMQSIKPFWFL
jgi:hypothetical protein